MKENIRMMKSSGELNRKEGKKKNKKNDRTASENKRNA